MPYTLLQGGRRRRRRPARVVALVLLLAALGAAGVVVGRALHGHHATAARHAARPAPAAKAPPPSPPAGGGTAPLPLDVDLADPADVVHLRFRHYPRGGLLFDIDTGRVLWRHDPTRVLPIASLTKMMTALVVVEREPSDTTVRITKEALAYKGSGVGILPRSKRIRLETMLNGLLLPSGNDAAIALAQRVSGTVRRFVEVMNERARRLGLGCTLFSSPSGFEDAGNHSCAADLARLAMAVLRKPRLARIVRRRQAVLPFPIKGGKIYLYNNNPLIRQAYPGVTGVKTGFTDAAGRCLVASARRGDVRLGVVLLHSRDPGAQARRLLDAGFRAARRVP